MKLYLNCNKPDSQVTWNKADYLLAAAERMGMDLDYTGWDEKAYTWRSKDKVLLYKGQADADYVLNIEPFDNFVKGKEWTGIWEIDVMFDREQMKIDNWIASDTVFLANTFYPDHMERFQGEKIFMFQACDPVLDKRVPDVKQEYDFVFSGSMGIEVYEERERCMEVLRKNGFSFCAYPKENPPHKYIEYLSSARVQFIRSACKLPIGYSQIEQRFFECLALGPVLKDYHPHLDKLGLIDGEDYWSYKNDEEMVFRMSVLIKDPGFAQRMAINGRRKALQYHTYDTRLAFLLNFIKEKTQQ